MVIDIRFVACLIFHELVDNEDKSMNHCHDLRGWAHCARTSIYWLRRYSIAIDQQNYSSPRVGCNWKRWNMSKYVAKQSKPMNNFPTMHPFESFEPRMCRIFVGNLYLSSRKISSANCNFNFKSSLISSVTSMMNMCSYDAYNLLTTNDCTQNCLHRKRAANALNCHNCHATTFR